MEKLSRRRLRSASVQLGALTALALTLSGCNQASDDDDCDSRSNNQPRNRTLSTASPAPVLAPAAVQTGVGRAAPQPVSLVPDQGGFGTHLASCGG